MAAAKILSDDELAALIRFFEVLIEIDANDNEGV